MPDEARSPHWRMLAGVAATAALAGFGVSKWTAPDPVPAPVAATPAAAGPAEVTIPAAYLASADIVVEPIATGGVDAEILAPATAAAQPGGEASIVARASGTIARLTKRIGDPVRRGEALALVDSLDAASMAADRSVAAAKADLAERSYAREAGLFRQGVTPRQDMETAQSALAVARAEARRAATVASAAHVAGNGRSIAVVSPIAGRITAQTAVLGAFVQPQVELFRVAGSSPAQIEASVPAADAARIAAGDRATILAGSGAPIPATVRSVTPTVSGDAHSATVVLVPSAGASDLIIGEGLQVRIAARRSSGTDGLIVPEDAVQNLEGHDVLFIRTTKGFRARSVHVGARTGGMAQIISGVKAGEQVATRNAFLVKAEMNKAGGDNEE